MSFRQMSFRQMSFRQMSFRQMSFRQEIFVIQKFNFVNLYKNPVLSGSVCLSVRSHTNIIYSLIFALIWKYVHVEACQKMENVFKRVWTNGQTNVNKRTNVSPNERTNSNLYKNIGLYLSVCLFVQTSLFVGTSLFVQTSISHLKWAKKPP